MTLTEARELLIAQATSVLNNHGFRLVVEDSKYDFIKRTNFGYQQIQVLPSFYGGNIELNLLFFIRIDEINHISNQFNSIVESASHTNPTFGFGLGLFNIRNDQLIANDKDSAVRVISLLLKIINEEVLALFQKYQTVDDIDSEFNRENRPINLFLHDINERPIIGLTAAALAKNPKFDFWEKYYRDRLKSATSNRRAKYESLVKHLRTIV